MKKNKEIKTTLKRKTSIHKAKKNKTTKETDIQKVVNHFFYSKGINLEQIKKDCKKRKIIYSRFTRPAKQLLELAGSLKKSKQAIDKISQWAKSRNLDYSIETIFKKWLELDKLKPKEIVKKPFYQGNPMIWSQSKKAWFVIVDDNEWREFAGEEKDIKWKKIK